MGGQDGVTGWGSCGPTRCRRGQGELWEAEALGPLTRDAKLGGPSDCILAFGLCPFTGAVAGHSQGGSNGQGPQEQPQSTGGAVAERARR